MKIKIISIGSKMPAWVHEAFADYQKRFPKNFAVQLVEVPSKLNSKNHSVESIIENETKLLLEKIEKNDYVIALDKTGKQHSTLELSKQIEHWQTLGKDVALLIGGAEGLTRDCVKHANATWSLSNLTFPHPLARVIVVEQLYRAFSLLNGHPYHRE